MSTSSTVVAVSGANRGIGLGYTIKLLELGYSVVAFCRNPEAASELTDLKNKYGDKLEIFKLDVAKQQSAKDAAAAVEKSALGGNGIDILINNAGVSIGPFQNGLLEANDTISDLKQNFEVNVIGAYNFITAFVPLLKKKAKRHIWIVSTAAGSLGHPVAQTPMAATYSISKAATNMLGLKFAAELEPEKFTVSILHPGAVETDMNPHDFPDKLTVKQAADYAIDVITKAGPETNRKFLSYDGTELPW